jgi:hypothetical protein
MPIVHELLFAKAGRSKRGTSEHFQTMNGQIPLVDHDSRSLVQKNSSLVLGQQNSRTKAREKGDQSRTPSEQQRSSSVR